jgi:hypothetical protein
VIYLAFSAILGDFGRLSAPRIDDFERFHPSQVGHFDPTDRPEAPRARMAGRASGQVTSIETSSAVGLTPVR